MSYAHILSQTRQVLGCRSAFLGLVQEDGAVAIVEQMGLASDRLTREVMAPGEGLAGRVIREGRTLVVDDYRAHPEGAPALKGIAAREGFVSLAGTPLWMDGKIGGVLYGAHESPGYFTPHHVELLEAYALGAALAVRLSRTAAELEASLAERRALFEGAADAILIHAPDTLEILEANEKACETYGYSKEEFRGLSVHDLDTPEQAAAVPGRVERLLRAGHVTFSTRHRTRAGAVLDVEVNAGLIRYSDGRCVVQSVCRDVTARRRLENQLAHAEKIAALGRLTAGVAHQLNNPLTVILGLTELAGGEPLDPIVRQDLDDIRKEANRAARIVRDLLTFAQQQESEKRPVDLNALTLRLLGRRTEPYAAAGIEVTDDLEAGLPPVWGDEHHLEQLVSHLLANAEAALAETRGRRRIVVASRTVEDVADDSMWIELAVADSGPGIPPGDVGRIFDPFFTTHGLGRAGGLGLSLCLGIAQDMGGTIMAFNRPTGGAEFVVRLPVGVC
ncbi:MAG: hypothetical protein Kow00122_03250 [Thermoleophilia bacterium]